MEVQVEDRLLAGRQARADHLLVEGGQERALVVMRQPAGVVSERGLLRQDRQAGQQRGGRSQQQVIDVGDAPGGGELARQQGQQVAGRADRPWSGVPGALYQAGQVEGDQAGMVSSSPAMVVWERPGRASKSMTAAAGRAVSRPEVAGLMLA